MIFDLPVKKKKAQKKIAELKEEVAEKQKELAEATETMLVASEDAAVEAAVGVLHVTSEMVEISEALMDQENMLKEYDEAEAVQSNPAAPTKQSALEAARLALNAGTMEAADEATATAMKKIKNYNAQINGLIRMKEQWEDVLREAATKYGRERTERATEAAKVAVRASAIATYKNAKAQRNKRNASDPKMAEQTTVEEVEELVKIANDSAKTQAAATKNMNRAVDVLRDTRVAAEVPKANAAASKEIADLIDAEIQLMVMRTKKEVMLHEFKDDTVASRKLDGIVANAEMKVYALRDSVRRITSDMEEVNARMIDATTTITTAEAEIATALTHMHHVGIVA